MHMLERMEIQIVRQEVLILEQNYAWSNRNQRPDQYRPPVISGSDMNRRRTGVATRNSQQAQRMSAARMTGNSQKNISIGPGQTEAGTGILPTCAPLANPYVPFQRENPPRYPSQRGLARGTMYPGLDLPLKGMVNSDKECTPLTELMALEFAVVELGLYLDTHPNDGDALEVFRDYVERAKEAKCAYEQKFGPLMLKEGGKSNCWDWICDPWPWDVCQEG